MKVTSVNFVKGGQIIRIRTELRKFDALTEPIIEETHDFLNVPTAQRWLDRNAPGITLALSLERTPAKEIPETFLQERARLNHDIEKLETIIAVAAFWLQGRRGMPTSLVRIVSTQLEVEVAGFGNVYARHELLNRYADAVDRWQAGRLDPDTPEMKHSSVDRYWQR